MAWFIYEANTAARLTALVMAGVGWLAWSQRQKLQERSPEHVAQVDRRAFLGAYAAYAAAAVIWLGLGLLPALAAAFPSFAEQLRDGGGAPASVRTWRSRRLGRPATRRAACR